MTKKKDSISKLIEKNNGYLLMKEALKIGISKTYIYDYIKENNIIKLSNGIYAKDNIWIDDLYVACKHYPKIILSGETALYLHNLTEKEPQRISATVYSGYNASNLKKNNFDITYLSKSTWEIGKTETKTNLGNLVATYDIDRTICDLIKNKNKYDIQVFNYALNEYMKSPNKSLSNLMKYAKTLKIEERVRIYTEIMI